MNMIKMKKQPHMVFVALMFLAVLLVPSVSVLQAGGENVTLTFYQAKLSHVLESLSKMTGTRMIANAELGERLISAYLENVSGDEAIDAILKANGLYREKIDDMET
jgi:type II secretory pathway component GspD/PulD (secretin)